MTQLVSDHARRQSLVTRTRTASRPGPILSFGASRQFKRIAENILFDFSRISWTQYSLTQGHGDWTGPP